MNRPAMIALATAMLTLLAACGSKEEAKKNAAAPGTATAAPAPADPLTVTADGETRKWVRTAPLPVVEFRDMLRVPASASVDETRVARIGASVTGRITELKAIVGQNVQRGQTLATLNSTELSNAQLVFLKALSAKLLAERAAERARQLFEADVIGAAELQRRETELSQAQAEMSAAHDQLGVLGMSEAGIRKLEASRTVNSQSFVVASIPGSVIERTVAQGQVVQPADAVFTVADLSRVWVQAEIPEKQADLVKPGDTVHVQIPALGDRDIRGRIVFVSATVNPETRTVTARTEVDNADRSIRPAMLATMLIQDRPRQRPVVPMEAVVREDNRDHVFVQKGEHRYRLVPVTLGAESDGLRPVLDGVKPNEVIVVDGAFHLNNERKQSLQ
ncbi:MAG: efflux RND transporter periplasmic adaptor subunit [Burkholderiales bacterium]